MRPELCGLLRLIFPYATLKFVQPTLRQQPLLWLVLDKQHLNMLFATLRLCSLFYRTQGVDTNGYEVTQHQGTRQHQFAISHVFMLSTWQLKLCVVTVVDSTSNIVAPSTYFSGLTWGERELSEMLGINFHNKLDARRLMLDYAFEGAPLRKSFPCIGFEELEYDARERWLVYRPLKYRDEIEF